MSPSDAPLLYFVPYGTALGIPPRSLAGTPAPRRILAPCPSRDTLVYEMRRYLHDEVAGRSCLIAGPRGSGKTTMMLAAWEELQPEFKHGCRLILVRLHGPSLLENSGSKTTSDIGLRVLKALVVNLYQTVAEEFSKCFQQHVDDLNSPRLPTEIGGSVPAPHGEPDPEMQELAAQLRLTLDGAPSAATLRSFWDRAEALPHGVLFPGLEPGAPGSRPNQAAAEIVALATTAEAYRRCSGKLKMEQTSQESASDKRELKEIVSAAGKELSQALISVGSGLAVGAAARSTLSGVGAALAGVVTAIASMATLNYSRTLSRESTLKEEVTFIPRLNVSTLVHRVPLLLLRLRQAGIAPVFYVDELDKVKNLSKPLSALASYLKFVCADSAFFCFLTDRAYLAETFRINRERTNAVQRTIFTNQLYVHYGTSSMYEFLDQVIQPVNRAGDADAQALRYVLMHRSRMLFSELYSELSLLKNSDGSLMMAREDPMKVPVHRFHLVVQLAIEYMLTDQLLADRINRDPDFTQTIYDALFYPTYRWYAGEQEIDCSPEALVDGISAFTGDNLDVTDSDRQTLHAQVKVMLDLVADPARLETLVRTRVASGRMRLEERVIQAVPGVAPLKSCGVDKEDKYVWVYNRFGIPHKAGDVTTILQDAQLQDSEGRLDRLSAILSAVPAMPGVNQVLAGVQSALDFLDAFHLSPAVKRILNDDRVAAAAKLLDAVDSGLQSFSVSEIGESASVFQSAALAEALGKIDKKS